MDTGHILKELERNTGQFPREALQAAVERREEITPELLTILLDAIERAEEIRNDPQYMAHVYALFLLAQFREQQAYPLVVEFFSLPGELSIESGGEGAIDCLDCILASVCGGHTGLIEKLIENQEVNDYVRGAAIYSLLVLVAAGTITRAQVMTYFKSLFAEKLNRFPSFVWDSLVHCATRLHPGEVCNEIRQVFEEGLASAGLISLEEVEAALGRNRECTLQKLPSSEPVLVEDAIEEMERWMCFDQEKNEVRGRVRKPKRRDAGFLFDNAIFHPDTIPMGSAGFDLRGARRTKKVGRNDPCPCGSGKKYKKCCLRSGLDSGDRTVQHPATVIAEPPSEEQIYQLKITLSGSDPPIWRRIQVANTMTLADLHGTIQVTMEWDGYHAHDFTIDGVCYGVPSTGSLFMSIEDETKTFLGNVVKAEGQKFQYCYDFGDNWTHELLLESIFQPEARVRYPVCLDGAMACPPEDCGGVWRYYSLLETAKDPGHPDYEDAVSWFGSSFDPETFSAEDVNRLLLNQAANR